MSVRRLRGQSNFNTDCIKHRYPSSSPSRNPSRLSPTASISSRWRLSAFTDRYRSSRANNAVPSLRPSLNLTPISQHKDQNRSEKRKAPRKHPSSQSLPDKTHSAGIMRAVWLCALEFVNLFSNLAFYRHRRRPPQHQPKLPKPIISNPTTQQPRRKRPRHASIPPPRHPRRLQPNNNHPINRNRPRRLVKHNLPIRRQRNRRHNESPHRPNRTNPPPLGRRPSLRPTRFKCN